MVGIIYNYLADLAQRKTFSQIRRYLISVVTFQEQTNEKVSERASFEQYSIFR